MIDTETYHRCQTENCENLVRSRWTKTEGDVYTHINGMRLDPNNLVMSSLCDECKGRVEEEKELNQLEPV